MSDLSKMRDDYLSLRRALGFKLKRQGELLADFVTFLDDAGSATITNGHAIAWATKPVTGTPTWWSARLDIVRAFARYVHTLDPRTEIPPFNILPAQKRRPQPYIFADDEIVALIAGTDRIRHRFRAETYRSIIGLLASTGMRVGEALALDHKDLNREEQLLTIRSGKFGKARQVPLHPTAFGALEHYVERRNRIFRRSAGAAFFRAPSGARVTYKNFQHAFFRLVDRAGLSDRKPRRPRIHDLRHTFATRTLSDCYQAGLDVERQLLVLSTYLGHSDPSGTYWYLSAVPELVALAAARLEQRLGVER
jgi:integrase/recombinase XerD